MKNASLFRQMMAYVKYSKGITYTEIAKQMGITRIQLYKWMNGENRLPKLQFYGVCRLYFQLTPLTTVDQWYSRIHDEIENGGALECLKKKKSVMEGERVCMKD